MTTTTTTSPPLLSFFFETMKDEQDFHHKLCMGMMYLSPIVFLFLRYVFPPNWGKTYQTLLGPKMIVPPRIGWCLFEIPNLIWAFISYMHVTATTGGTLPGPNKLLLSLFVGHYINRSIIYPLTLNPNSKPLPLEIVVSALLYTTLNGYIQSQALCQFGFGGRNGSVFPDQYLTSPQFLLGFLVFGTGVAINWQSDHILRNLRSTTTKQPAASKKDSNTNTNTNSHYVIPHGGGFRWVSNPHYLGEIIEWTGFAIASNNSAAAWSFVLFTCANLIPRAVAHHQWYLNKFGDKYPRNRTAVIPFLV